MKLFFVEKLIGSFERIQSETAWRQLRVLMRCYRVLDSMFDQYTLFHVKETLAFLSKCYCGLVQPKPVLYMRVYSAVYMFYEQKLYYYQNNEAAQTFKGPQMPTSIIATTFTESLFLKQFVYKVKAWYECVAIMLYTRRNYSICLNSSELVSEEQFSKIADIRYMKKKV